jgi:hypothetical protein
MYSFATTNTSGLLTLVVPALAGLFGDWLDKEVYTITALPTSSGEVGPFVVEQKSSAALQLALIAVYPGLFVAAVIVGALTYPILVRDDRRMEMEKRQQRGEDNEGGESLEIREEYSDTTGELVSLSSSETQTEEELSRPLLNGQRGTDKGYSSTRSDG